MRIGILHNAYRYRGGEDLVVETESELLENNGHHVSKMILDNTEIFATLGKTMRSMPTMGMGWNTAIGDRLVEWVREEGLDLVHCHNIYPVISPAALMTMHAHRIPIVMTLHNFRPICANGLQIRDGKPCVECTTKGCSSALKYGCYRQSRLQSASWMIGRVHAQHSRVWDRSVSQFIAPSEYVRQTFLSAGFDPSRITVRPHTVPARCAPTKDAFGALCVGRLDQSKGVYELAHRWPVHAEPLTFIGTGPEEIRIKKLKKPNVHCLGWCEPQRVAEHMSRCRVVIQPSKLNETFGLTIAEGASVARPSVAFNKGGVASIIDHNQTGLLVDTNSMADLCNAALDLITRPIVCLQMGLNANDKYSKTYSPRAGIRSLLDVYTLALSPSARVSA